MGGCCETERKLSDFKPSQKAQNSPSKDPSPAKSEKKESTVVKAKPRKQLTLSIPVSPGNISTGRSPPKAPTTPRKRASFSGTGHLKNGGLTPKPQPNSVRRMSLWEGKSASSVDGEVSAISIKFLSKSIFEKYRKLSELYSDRVTNVYLSQNRISLKHRIVKVMRKSPKTGSRKETKIAAEEQFRSEVVTVSNLDHPNILKIFKLYEDKQSFYSVSEPINGGNLIDYITTTKTLSEVFAAKVIHQVLQVLNYCHKLGVMHRSVQPSCILLVAVGKWEDPIVKVTGFGSAHLLTDQEKLTLSVSSAYYVAPETLRRKYSEKSDVWSLGVILYQLLNGTPPFLGQFVSDIVSNILKKHPSFPQSQWNSVSREAVELVTAMLSKNPKSRVSVEDCLRHPWIQRYKDQMIASAQPVKQALSNLQQFKVNQVLKQAVMKFMSEEVENSEETKELVKAFKTMDKNGDGVLSREELISAYEKSMSHDRACFTVDQVMKTIDTDKSGTIDFSEFMLASFNNKTILSQSNVQVLFRLFDEDGSGKVSVEELKEKVRSKDNSVSDDLWDELVRQVDSNGDGELDFEEFSQLLKLAVAV